MLVADILGWHWAISWDNAKPNSDSTKLIAALEELGNVTKIETKTTVILAPKADVSETQIRDAITSNLNPTIGNVFYVNLQARETYEWGKTTQHTWSKVI